MAWDDILNGLVDTGKSALNNIVNKATLGDKAATDIALAKERDYYAGLNGSGPTDRQGALKDSYDGDYHWRNPFDFAGGGGGQTLAIIGVFVLMAVLIFKRR